MWLRVRIPGSHNTFPDRRFFIKIFPAISLIDADSAKYASAMVNFGFRFAIRRKAPLNKLCAIAWSVWSATRRGSLEVEFHMRSACEWCPKMIGNGAIIWRNIECKIYEGRFIWTGLCLCYVFFSFVHSAATISSAEQNKLFTAVENIYSREFTRLVGTYFAMHCDLFTSTGAGVCDWSTVSRPQRTRTWFSSPKVQILTEFSSLFTHAK